MKQMILLALVSCLALEGLALARQRISSSAGPHNVPDYLTNWHMQKMDDASCPTTNNPPPGQ